MNKHEQLIAACGLNCNECDIFQAPNNLEIAQRIVDWFKKERNTQIKIENICCSGCKGVRTKHWSPNCWILKCCVDKKELEFCYQCADFSCEKLDQWAKESNRYGEALNQLKEMKRK